MFVKTKCLAWPGAKLSHNNFKKGKKQGIIEKSRGML